jgi:transposase
VLGDIQTDYDNFRHGRLPQVVSTPSLWHIDAVGGRPPHQIYAWKKQLQEHAARVFDPKIGQDAEAASNRVMEKLHAKIGQLTIENDFFAKRFGK